MEQKSYFLEFSIDHAQFLPKVVVQACPLPECFSLEEQTPTLPKAAILSSCLPLFPHSGSSLHFFYHPNPTHPRIQKLQTGSQSVRSGLHNTSFIVS